MTVLPHVILLDDKNEAEHLIPASCTRQRFSPADILATQAADMSRSGLPDAVRRADLVLVDQELDLPPELSLRAFDGAGMIGLFRSWARKTGTILPPLVIFTNRQEAYEREVPAIGVEAPLGGSFVGSEHRLAPAMDVEWLLYKHDELVSDKIDSLASSYKVTCEAVGKNGTSFAELIDLLRVPADATWVSLALEHVRRARPPVNQSGDAHHAELPRAPALVLRWLLHHALPFAGMVFSEIFVAWSLNVTPKSLREFLKKGRRTQLFESLEKAKYTGPLHGIVGERWWRAGIDSINGTLLDLAEAKGSAQAALDETAGEGALEVAPTRDEVVVYDDQFVPTEIVPINQAQELQVPGWPAEAMAPWATVEDVLRDPLLAALAVDGCASAASA